MTDAETIVMPRIGASEAGVEDPWGEDHAPGGRDAKSGRGTGGRTAGRVGILSWLVPALLMGMLGTMGAAAPGLWTEELTTWDRATSSWRENLSPANWADLGSAPYHLAMNAWVTFLGASDLVLRAPSVLAMTVAAALVGALASRLFGTRVGLLAGVIFALLPTSTRYAQEAGPYAIALMLAVLATYFLVLAVDRPKRWRFVGYGAAVLVLGLFHAVALVLLAGHAWAVVAFGRRVAGRWLVAAGVGVLPAIVLCWLVTRSAGLSAWLPDADPGWLTGAPGELFGVTALGVLLLGLALFSLPLRRSAAVYTAWAVVPVLVLLLVTWVTPLPLSQCLLFTLPAWATLGAAALGRIRSWWGTGAGIAVLAAIVVVGLPAQATLRTSDGHRQATRHLAQIVESGMRSGDGVLFSETDPGAGWAGRGALDRYMSTDRRPVELATRSVGVGATAGVGGSAETGGRFPAAGCGEATRCLGDTRRVWLVRVGEWTDPMHAIGDREEELLRARYETAQIWRLTGFTLALLVDERLGV